MYRGTKRKIEDIQQLMVIGDNRTEFPHIASFSSLSPIPGFRDWLMSQINLQMHRATVASHNFSFAIMIGEEDSDQMLLTSAEMQTLENCRINTGYVPAFPHACTTRVNQIISLCSSYRYRPNSPALRHGSTVMSA
ncbi:hypothetical protein C0Q70_11520 [Pomacea canaliculata]|uniref:Malonyl-CoA decarboxylase C-terminal domain-containing protein n=1 Tax=Pomacea canaliculata TaxID=400727 RepID=A0A2T7P675_POMCA|nr:hypothetical protein C0Q70_11520 [Pomacea canaliculata]